MTQFELFSALFYALASMCERAGGRQYRESSFKDDTIQNENLQMFLSDANPFLCEGVNRYMSSPHK